MVVDDRRIVAGAMEEQIALLLPDTIVWRTDSAGPHIDIQSKNAMLRAGISFYATEMVVRRDSFSNVSQSQHNMLFRVEYADPLAIEKIEELLTEHFIKSLCRVSGRADG
jgi:hypothetical protein